MNKLLFILFIFVSAFCYSSHNRAGEISYKRVQPFTSIVGGVSVPTYSYLITVTVYSDFGQDVADRCADTVYFGDGQIGIAFRVNGGFSGCNCPPLAQCGQEIINSANYNVKLNTYTITHVYAGAGRYLIRMIDPNRNAGVHNMTNSSDQAFYVESLLVIYNLNGANSSPIFNYQPLDRACKDKCFYHNPGAYDPDGDLLTYEISTPRKGNGQTVDGYFNPSSEGGTFNINSSTGLLTWCSPKFKAEYNIAFIVKEWRKNSNGDYQLMGYVLRDMQVVVDVCPNNDPPSIIVPQDTCVEAGTLIQKKLTIVDQTPSPFISSIVKLEGNAGAFAATSPKAVISNTSAIATYTSLFTWQTTCNHIQLQPYESVFKVKDNGSPVNLVGFNTYKIRVVPPSVKNVSATPIGSNIKIIWTPSSCSPTNNPLVSYKIYRKNNCAPYPISPCITGVPLNDGFVFLGQTNSSTYSFIDNNNGIGLIIGQNYGYILVAAYKDSSETFASAMVCAKLKSDIPIILNVDVLSTGVSNGSIQIKWENPIISPSDLDTIAFPGPYQLNIKYRSSSTESFITIFNNTSTYFLGLSKTYTHTGVNTQTLNAQYKIEFIAGPIIFGSSQVANSVSLTAEPSDRKIKLSWQANTPWTNYKYTIYKKTPLSLTYTFVTSTTLNSFVDSVKIVNRYNYCYKVLSEGQYSDPSIFKPLLNNSQEVCVTAKDIISPCSPTLGIESDCPLGYIKIKWPNPKLICKESDDVIKYILFFKPTLYDNFSVVDTFYGANSTVYSPDFLISLSGCYAIQAIDSSGNISPLSSEFCLDNCPLYELPNIITPNADQANDHFKAIKIRQIKQIDLIVYDRWGNIVYKTEDPYFEWNGVSIFSNQPVSEGTFFYLCHVYEIRLKGIVKRTIKGYFQVMR